MPPSPWHSSSLTEDHWDLVHSPSRHLALGLMVTISGRLFAQKHWHPALHRPAPCTPWCHPPPCRLRHPRPRLLPHTFTHLITPPLLWPSQSSSPFSFLLSQTTSPLGTQCPCLLSPDLQSSDLITSHGPTSALLSGTVTSYRPNNLAPCLPNDQVLLEKKSAPHRTLSPQPGVLHPQMGPYYTTQVSPLPIPFNSFRTVPCR